MIAVRTVLYCHGVVTVCSTFACIVAAAAVCADVRAISRRLEVVDTLVCCACDTPNQRNWIVVCGLVSTAAYVYVYWNKFADGVNAQEFQGLPVADYLSLALAGCTGLSFLAATLVCCVKCF